MSLFIDIHILQTLPPSNINRDDTGSPKSAIFGGVERTRVSSQAWKSSVRRNFETYLDSTKIGVRTRRIADKIVDRIAQLAPAFDPDKAESAVRESFKTVKIKVEDPKKEGSSRGVSSYLLFLSNQQIDRLAQAIIDADGEKLTAKEVKDILNTEHSVDIALFGRMLADAPDFNVDASCQVAHALGVHAADTDFDYFTAVDDYVRNAEDESGAGMIGTVEMASSTLYRYATVNLSGLESNLGEPAATVEAACAFTNAFIETMPTGKQNTFAARTLPEVVVVTIRDKRPVSYVNAFEKPITAGEHGRRLEATRALAKEAKDIQESYGYEPVASYTFGLGDLKAELEGLGEEVTLPQMKEKLEAKLTELLTQEG